MSVTTISARTYAQHQPGWFARLLDNKAFLIIVCLAPAIGLLGVFLTYPLGLGVWLAFTDTTRWRWSWSSPSATRRIAASGRTRSRSRSGRSR